MCPRKGYNGFFMSLDRNVIITYTVEVIFIVSQDVRQGKVALDPLNASLSDKRFTKITPYNFTLEHYGCLK
jgi:hypothetical protein